MNNANNLTFTGTLRILNSIASSAGLLDALTNSPTIEFGGSSPQTIENTPFLDSKVYNLTIDNSISATLTTNLTINNNMVINTGKVMKVSPGKSINGYRRNFHYCRQ